MRIPFSSAYLRDWKMVHRGEQAPISKNVVQLTDSSSYRKQLTFQRTIRRSLGPPTCIQYQRISDKTAPVPRRIAINVMISEYVPGLNAVILVPDQPFQRSELNSIC